MEMSLKLSTHFSAFMLFQPSFFLFLLFLLEAFTNRQVQGLRNFHRACVQNRSKENWYFSGSRKSRGTVDLWIVGLKQDDIVEYILPGVNRSIKESSSKLPVVTGGQGPTIQELRLSVMVLVWSTTVLSNVRLRPSRRLMLSPELVTLLMLPLLLEVTQLPYWDRESVQPHVPEESPSDLPPCL